MFATRAVILLVIDHEIEGFFTGPEIIRKLRTALIRFPAVLVSSNASLDADESRRLGLIVPVDAAANNDDIAETVRRFLAPCPDEQKLNSRAGSSHRLPVWRSSCLATIDLAALAILEMPAEEVPIDDLRRGDGIDPKASAVLLDQAITHRSPAFLAKLRTYATPCDAGSADDDRANPALSDLRWHRFATGTGFRPICRVGIRDERC